MNEDRIRERAHALWEKEGRPEGRDVEFWERARSMLAVEDGPEPVTPLQSRSGAEKELDKALADTFPASDPPATARPG